MKLKCNVCEKGPVIVIEKNPTDVTDFRCPNCEVTLAFATEIPKLSKKDNIRFKWIPNTFVEQGLCAALIISDESKIV